MKLFRKIFFIFLIFLFVFLTLISFYIRFYGETLLTTILKKAFRQDVIIRDLRYDFPFGLKSSYLAIGDFFQCQKISIQANLFDFYKRQWHFLSIVFDKPVLVIRKDVPLPNGGSSSEQNNFISPVNFFNVIRQQSLEIPIFIDALLAHEGKIFYKKDGKDLWQMDAINAQIKHIAWPVRDRKLAYHFSGVFVKDGMFFSQSQIESFGWVNGVKKDLDSVMHVLIPSGKVKLSAHAVAENNRMTVSGHFSLREMPLGFQNIKQENSLASSWQAAILNAVSDWGVAGDVRFSFATTLTDFQINKINFEGDIQRP